MEYHLTGTNFNDPNFEALEQSSLCSWTIPDVMLVKKHYPRKKKSKSRNWRLKRMNKDEHEPTSPRENMIKIDWKLTSRCSCVMWRRIRS